MRVASVKVDPDRLNEEWARPDIVALVEAGYTVGASLPFEERGQLGIVLILNPPPKARDERAAVPVGAAIGIAVGLLVGFLVVLGAAWL